MPVLLLIVAAFVGSRLLWVMASPETASYWEELYRWVAAREILHGPTQPLLEYQADHYQGGSLLLIALGVPVMGLAGPSLTAFKSVAIAFSTATLVVLWALCRRFFGAGAAAMAALAYLAGPPLVAFWGVVVMGFHAESTLAVLVQVYVFLGLVTGAWRSPAGWAALGLACGLGFWFSATAALGAVACVLSWPLLRPLRERPPRAGELLAAGAGLAAGLVPWWVYNAPRGFVGLDRLVEVMGGAGTGGRWTSVWERAVDLLAHVLPVALLDPSGDALGGALQALLSVGFVVPLALGWWASFRRGGLERVFHVFAGVFVAAYLLSTVTVDRSLGPIAYRVFPPLAVMLLVPACVSAARALGTGRSGGLRAAAAVLSVVGLGSMAAATLAFATRPVENVALTPERGYDALGMLAHRKWAPDVERSLETVRRIGDPELRRHALVGIGWEIQDRFERGGSLAELEARLRAIPAHERSHVLRGMTWFADIRNSELEWRRDTERQERVRALREVVSGLEEGGLDRPSLLLVTLDTTRVDHLSSYGYARKTTPELDALARRGVRYDRVWSTSSWTLPAHASLFTGLHPATHGARFDAAGPAVLGDRVPMPIARLVRAGVLARERTTLAELLSEAGYRTGAFVAGPWLHRSFGLLQGFETMDDEVSSFGGRPAEEVTDAAIGWLEAGRQGRASGPFFLFVNYFDPHAPYRPPPGFDDLPRAGEPAPEWEAVLAGERRLGADERKILVDRYDGEIRYMDHHLGRLLRAVEAAPGGERALIVVTADHGEALGEEGRVGHTYWLSEEILRVPLVVRYPDGRGSGSVETSPLSLVDVLALVTAELRVAMPEETAGMAPGTRRLAFAELYREPTAAARFGERFDRDLGAVVRWPFKLTRSSRGQRWLVELEPGGTAERPLEDGELAQSLGARLDAHESRLGRARIRPAEVEPGLVETLRSLGYVE